MEAWEHMAMGEDGEPNEFEDPDQAQGQESGESEEAGMTGPIDLSGFYAAAFNPLQDYVRKQNAWIGKILAESAAVRMRPVLPRIVLDSPLIRMNAVTENLRRQMADLTGFNDMVRQALQPLGGTYQPPQCEFPALCCV
jgi:hypothetical protein